MPALGNTESFGRPGSFPNNPPPPHGNPNQTGFQVYGPDVGKIPGRNDDIGATPSTQYAASGVQNTAGLGGAHSMEADAEAALSEESSTTAQQTTAGSQFNDMMDYMRMCAEARIRR